MGDALSTEGEERLYDYVVVGSGAGGGPLAANLARAGMSVLLLEAGADAGGLNYSVPAFHANATEDPAIAWEFYVDHYFARKQARRDPKYVVERSGVLYPRAGTLGGCTAHNAMITVYPADADWDGIARATHDRSWSSRNMRRHFERLERCRYAPRPRRYPRRGPLLWLVRVVPLLRALFGNRSRHGFSGWLSTELPNPKLALKDLQLIRVVLAAAKQTLEEDLRRPLSLMESLSSYFDPNDARAQRTQQQGLWLTPLATDGGRRNGTREYIRRIERESGGLLVVRTGALATRVILDRENRAVGVEYLEGDRLYSATPDSKPGPTGAPIRQARVGREVVLAAGAFNTPQLLKLSGVGPRDELTAHGIDVRVDLPGVGRNLQDRYEVGVITQVRDDFRLLANCTFGAPGASGEPDPCLADWERGEGVYRSNGVILGIVRRSKPERPVPDLFIFGLPALFKGYLPGYSELLSKYDNIFTWAILKAHTLNTGGTVTLRSSDPRDVPEVNFHYFDEGNDASGEDLESVVEAIEFVRRLMRHAEGVAEQEIMPGPEFASREDLKRFVRDHAWGHHASCSCKIGAAEDRMAVLDSDFRVRGTRGLRVVDASVFPHIPGFFLVTAIYMVSEKATDAILADARPTRAAARRVGKVMRRVLPPIPARPRAGGPPEVREELLEEVSDLVGKRAI